MKKLLLLLVFIPSLAFAQIAPVAPTISSGFGTGAAIGTGGTSSAFTIGIGTGGTATNGVIGFQTAAPHGWICFCDDQTTISTTVFRCRGTPTSTTTATLTNYSTSGTASAWVASDTIQGSCYPN